MCAGDLGVDGWVSMEHALATRTCVDMHGEFAMRGWGTRECVGMHGELHAQ